MANRRVCVASDERDSRGPQKLSELLAELMSRRGYARQLDSQQFEQHWQAAVHPAIARASRPTRLRAGILEIAVANSTILQELTFQKATLVARLRQAMPLASLVDLRFRIGPVE